jgi:hypothetical protein
MYTQLLAFVKPCCYLLRSWLGWNPWNHNDRNKIFFFIKSFMNCNEFHGETLPKFNAHVVTSSDEGCKECKKKVKQTRHRPGVAQRVPGS